MSEVKLNLVDAQQTLHGVVHGSIADACVAALSAEPETIVELEAALARYVRRVDQAGAFTSFRSSAEVDTEPWDAGVVIIDLEARIVAAESSYSQPQPEGEVLYHDGTRSTDIAVLYRVPEEWMFLSSLDEYESSRRRHSKDRVADPPLDARSVLYGRALLDFITCELFAKHSSGRAALTNIPAELPGQEPRQPALAESQELEISAIHARWLTTPRDDLRGQSPRDVLLARQEFIDFDLHTRELQWTFQGEGPPCLAQHSFAYRFAGFGTHECVVYYDLVRHLLWNALENVRRTPVRPPGEIIGELKLVGRSGQTVVNDIEAEISRLERVKNEWLENQQPDYEGSIPAIIIENERRRLPLALQAKDLLIDEDCDLCVMSANQAAMGYGPSFWHLDGSHMDDHFAFSFFRTRQEWDDENRRCEEFNREFDRRWEERQQCLARGEQVDPDPFLDLELNQTSDPDKQEPDLIQ
jgi:hypothetical protein